MDSYDKKERLRRRVFDLIQIGHREDPVSRLFDFVIVTTIDGDGVHFLYRVRSQDLDGGSSV